MLRLNIDGKEITGFPGQTILEVARENGIEIPTLCYDERVKPYGGCGLCVVEAEGSSKLLRACATEIAQGMVLFTDTPRVRESRRLTLELLLSDHTGDCRPPCVLACPAHTDCQGYAALIANGCYQEALALIKEQLPLPASIGRVCPHPCEDACRRALVEEPVSLAALKAFVADQDLALDVPYLPEIQPDTGKKVAVVGAGPAGLTAAYFLARSGHQVTVYDAMPQGGGMLRYGIPVYRLPDEVIDQELDLIARLGVRFIYNTKVGRDITLDYLKENFDAVFLGIGAWKSSGMRCQGEELPGVLGGIDFLREVALHGKVSIGERVAVVGGGNTAMDAARTAVRLGAKEVMVLYRRTREEMPAEEIEIEEAEEEGVLFKFLVSPLDVIGDQNGITAIRLQKMRLGEPDASGRRRPVPIEGEEETLPVDTIISAIGQKVAPDGLDGVALSQWGTLDAAEDTLMTSIPGIFAGGDAVTGPGIAIEAVAQGKQAAEAIDRYLNGDLRPLRTSYLVKQEGLTAEDFADQEKAPRAKMPQLTPDERKSNFRQVNLGLSEDDAVAEAARCLECGCRDYFECKLIKYAGDYDVQPERIAGSKHKEKVEEQHPFLERNSDKCILCGLCVRVCEEKMGVTALGLVGRGFETLVMPEFGLPLQETPCISCGQCVAVCPTGALVERLPLDKNLPMVMESSDAVCSFCGVGCEMVINTRGSLVARALPPKGEILCRKGRFGFESFGRERLTKPLVRRNGKLEETSWEEAFQEVAGAVLSLRARSGSEALAVSAAPSYSLEEAEALVGFGRLALGTSKIITFTPDAAVSLAEERYPGSFAELENTDLVLLVGSCEECQVAAVKAREAVKNGAQLVVVSPEPNLADDLADLRLAPDNTTGFLKEVLAAVLEQGIADEDSLREKAGGYDDLKKALDGVEAGDFAKKLVELYCKAEKAVILVDGHTVTPAAVELLADLALLTGKTGSPRNGLLVVTPGSNMQGIKKLGITSGAERLKEALQQGEVQGLFICGEDPVGAGLLSAEDLQKAELLVVISPFKTETAELADLVLPGSVPLEGGGTFINSTGEYRSFSPVVVPSAGVSNLELIEGLAAALGIRHLKTVSGVLKEGEPDGKPVLFLPRDDELFRAVPVTDPALRKFNDKLQQEFPTSC